MNKVDQFLRNPENDTVKKKVIFGVMSFTHNYGRSRIIMVVHARFTQVHAGSR